MKKINFIPFEKQSQSGQVVIFLLLLVLVVLSVGLALSQKSITDLTSSTQTEQASRAFSAAEAGIEKALTGTVPSGSSFQLENQSTAMVDTSAELPLPSSGAAIEYPPIGRETTAQIWFTDPRNPSTSYGNNTFNLYFGNENTEDKPALELKILMESAGQFYTQTYYLDSDGGRVYENNFTFVPGCSTVTLPNGILGDNRRFYCQQTIGPIPNPAGGGTCPSATCKLILARVRFLYIDENHGLALAPISADFPPQVRIYNATGTSGQSEKQIQAFRVVDVIPPWFDFAVFSVDEIRK